MNREDIRKELQEMTDDHMVLVRPLIEQAITKGAIFGSEHFPVANQVRKALKVEIDKFPEFSNDCYGDTQLKHMIEKAWPDEMLTLQSIVLGNGKKWIENFDEKSAHEGFIAGVYFIRRQIHARLVELLKDERNETE